MEKINNKLRLSKQKLTSLPFRKIAPNIVTMLALCAGVTSIRYSIAENWAMAVICIFLAAFFDGLQQHKRGWIVRKKIQMDLYSI